MKNLFNPAPLVLAALALGGCAGTAGLTTTEPDGVYYSSSDRTTAVASAAPAAYPDASSSATPAPDDANPDYRGGNSTSPAAPNAPSYYDDGYANSGRFRQPYTGPSVSYYTPSWAATPAFYNDPFYSGYGWGGGYCGYSPYSSAFYDPFWGPSYYSPWGYGSGWSVSIGYGWGRPWGGGYYGYGRPYGYGGFYGGGFYDPFYYGGYPYYSGYYGRGGGYYGPRYVYNNYNNYAGGDRGNTVRVGHRRDRSVEAVGGRGSAGPVNTGGVVVAPNNPAGGGRPRLESRAPVAPNGGGVVSAPTNEGGRARVERTGKVATGSSAPAGENPVIRPDRVRLDQPAQYGSYNQPSRIDAAGDAAPQPAGNSGGRPRWRDAAPAADNNGGYGQPASQPQPAAVPAPSEQRGRRGGFFQEIFSAPAPSNNADQYGSGRRRDNGGFERPSRSFEQPQQQPSRSFERPSYSEPSFGGSRGGGGGGGNSGGGGGRRGRMQ